MPANDRQRTVYYGVHAFDTQNEATLYKPGELGTIVVDVASDRRGQIVQVDSGCTSGSVTGTVTAGELAFWKDKSRALVTNDPAQANAINAPAGGWSNGGNASLDARNFVAGVFQTAVTAAYYTIILQRTNVAGGFAVKARSGGAFNAGNTAVAYTGTAADIDGVAAGTAASSRSVGIVVGSRVSATGKVPVWVNILEED